MVSFTIQCEKKFKLIIKWGLQLGEVMADDFDEIYFEYRTHKIIIMSFAHLWFGKVFMENLCNFQAEILLTSLTIQAS